LLGVAIFSALFWMVFFDCVAVSRMDKGLTGALAAGWSGVVAVYLVATVYNTFYQFSSMTYLYWYFAGAICARRMALRYEDLHSAAIRRRAALA
jgi:hypothetical protein